MKRRFRWLAACAVISALANAACLSNLNDQDGTDDGDKQAWDGTVIDIIPQAPFDYMVQHGWPGMHYKWHGARQWYVILDDAYIRTLTSLGVTPASLQEGDAASSIEAAAMHRAMVEALRAKFGDVPVDYLGKSTFGEVLDGWQDFAGPLFMADNPEGAIAVRAMRDALRPAAEFASLDDYAQYVWTRLRRRSETPDDYKFRLDNTAGVGFHNAVHGRLADKNSRVNLGRPSTNLFNMTFWSLHGYVDALIEGYLADQATAEERALFELYRAQAADHLADMEATHQHGNGDDKAYVDDPTNGFFPTWDDCATLPENIESSACP